MDVNEFSSLVKQALFSRLNIASYDSLLLFLGGDKKKIAALKEELLDFKSSVDTLFQSYSLLPEGVEKAKFFSNLPKKKVNLSLDEAKDRHRQRIKLASEIAQEDVNSKLEDAQENAKEAEIKALLSTRKILKTLHRMDLTHCKSIDDVNKTIPKELEYVWGFNPLT